MQKVVAGATKSNSINNYLSAYLNVFKVCSQDPALGEMQDIITVRLFPTKESLSTSVNLLPLKGMWFWSLSSALMHSFSASKLLLISAPSILHNRRQVNGVEQKEFNSKIFLKDKKEAGIY